MSRRAVANGALAALTAVHLAAGLAGRRRLSDLTQPLLMPAVAARLLADDPPRGRTRTSVLIGLGTSCLGDTLPRLQRDEAAFLTLVGCFVGTHLAYLSAFGPDAWRRARREPRAAVLPVLGYGALLTFVLRRTLPGARLTGLDGAVVGYGALLCATGVATALRGGRVALGGATFAVSDALIALGRFVPGWRARVGTLDVDDLLVMSTYVLAQILIADGVAQPDREG